jgi:hypothetical protein
LGAFRDKHMQIVSRYIIIQSNNAGKAYKLATNAHGAHVNLNRPRDGMTSAWFGLAPSTTFCDRQD